MTKPTVFNYKQHEELRQAYKELLADNQQLTADNRKLRKEVTELKQLNDGYVKIIAKNQETNNKLMASVQKQTGGDYINRADAIEMAVDVETPQGTYERAIYVDDLMALPSADAEKPCKTCGYYNLECPKDCEYQSADAEPKWNCTANFIAEQLERLREMTD